MQDVDRLERGDDDRFAVVARDEVVGPRPDHGRDVSGCDKGVDLDSRRREDRLERRADRDVVAEGAEVAHALLARTQERDCGRRRRRLEADREEDDLAGSVAASASASSGE